MIYLSMISGCPVRSLAVKDFVSKRQLPIHLSHRLTDVQGLTLGVSGHPGELLRHCSSRLEYPRNLPFHGEISTTGIHILSFARIGIGRPSRAFPPTSPGIRVRTRAIR